MAIVPSNTIYLGKASWVNNPLTGLLTVPQNLFLDYESGTEEGYDTSIALNGSGSKIHSWIQGQTGDLFGEGPEGASFYMPIKDVLRGDQLWFQVYLYSEAGWSWQSTGQGRQTKFFRISTLLDDRSNGGKLDWTVGDIAAGAAWQYIYEGGIDINAIDKSTGYKPYGTPDKLPKNGVWEEFQCYARFDTQAVDDGGMAEVKFWKDEELLFHNTSRRTIKTEGSYIDHCEFNPYWNGGAPNTQNAWIDDVTITNIRPDYQDAQGNYKIPSKLNYA